MTTPRQRERARERRESGEYRPVNCNLCCPTYDRHGNVETPGCLHDSCSVICEKCPKCPSSNKTKVSPEGVVVGSPSVHTMQRGGKKTRKKRRRKRRKTHKKRKKTKRKKRRRKKKKSRRRRK